MENQEQNHPTAILSWSLDIECPKCKKGIDLADYAVHVKPCHGFSTAELQV
ncbi:MAG: hypothetical protein KFF68_14130 [Desulfosarcina sp.]|nr:hypothetical protein [Desulfosarcina sp.]